MTIDLDPETQRLIEQEIQAGHFRDAGAVVGAAMRHFVITREDPGYTREEIDAMIDEATAPPEAGLGVDGDEFFAELEREAQEARYQRG